MFVRDNDIVWQQMANYINSNYKSNQEATITDLLDAMLDNNVLINMAERRYVGKNLTDWLKKNPFTKIGDVMSPSSTKRRIKIHPNVQETAHELDLYASTSSSRSKLLKLFTEAELIEEILGRA